MLPLPASVPCLRVTIQAQARSLELGCKNRGKAEAAIDECLPNRRPEVLREAAAASLLHSLSLFLFDSFRAPICIRSGKWARVVQSRWFGRFVAQSGATLAKTTVQGNG